MSLLPRRNGEEWERDSPTKHPSYNVSTRDLDQEDFSILLTCPPKQLFYCWAGVPKEKDGGALLQHLKVERGLPVDPTK